MFSLYSFPNIILPFIAGIIITKFGNNCMLLSTTILVTLGQIFFTIGILNENIFLTLVGRFLFGVGGESNGIPLNSLIIKWFDKSNLAFSLGLNISGGRIATVLNDIITPYISKVINILK
jgi:MFS family permease